MTISRNMSTGMDHEGDIHYENGPFFAIKVKNGYEIRKNANCYAVIVGNCPSLADATRFIDRAVRYPNSF